MMKTALEDMGGVHTLATASCYYVPCYNQRFACSRSTCARNVRLIPTQVPICSCALAHSMHASYVDQRPNDTAEYHNMLLVLSMCNFTVPETSHCSLRGSREIKLQSEGIEIGDTRR